jgi:hypothetical protein
LHPICSVESWTTFILVLIYVYPEVKSKIGGKERKKERKKEKEEEIRRNAASSF